MHDVDPLINSLYQAFDLLGVVLNGIIGGTIARLLLATDKVAKLSVASKKLPGIFPPLLIDAPFGFLRYRLIHARKYPRGNGPRGRANAEDRAHHGDTELTQKIEDNSGKQGGAASECCRAAGYSATRAFGNRARLYVLARNRAQCAEKRKRR